MSKFPSMEKLDEAITVAEKILEELESKPTSRVNRKRKRVTKALEHAYATLNLRNYTEKELNERTDEIWHALVDDDPITMTLLFLVVFSLSGILIFTVQQAYSFLKYHLDKKTEVQCTIPIENPNSKVKIDYSENNVISLYDRMSTTDDEGLQKEPKKITISNNSKDINKQNYLVKYAVYIEPLNDPKAYLLKEERIKLKYTYTDSKGDLRESEIMTLANLPKSTNGSFVLTRGIQAKDSKTDFNIYFWVSSQANNAGQDSTYTLRLKADASID